MNSAHPLSGTGEHTIVITRVAQTHWHALEDDRVVGRGEATRRPDGRFFLSIDCWHDVVFEQLAAAMLAALPRPLYTVVDEAEVDLRTNWHLAGFTTRRREWECLVPTDPRASGLGSARPPSGVTVVSLGGAQEDLLRRLDREIRDEVEATIGWHEMPAEVLGRPDADTIVDPSKYAAATLPDQYVGLVRVTTMTRLPRIGLIAVRADQRRRGIARALLADVLGSLRHAGIDTVSVEVNESNLAAMGLFEGVGAWRTGSNLELILR